MLRQSRPTGCLALAFLAVWLLLPFFFADMMVTALARLGLSPILAVQAALGILLGGLINIPVARIRRTEPVLMPARMFGIDRFWFPWEHAVFETIIAVNLGGCVIPTAIAGYQLARLAGTNTEALFAAVLSIGINTAVCYWLAYPIPNVGIAMPALIPPSVAALTALLLMPTHAPPIAFSAGVLGPLLGADLLHLKEIQRISAGMASIGGAGTFDGIVLSGLVATLLV